MASRYTLDLGDKVHVPNNSYIQIQRQYKNLGRFFMTYDYALRKAYDEAGEAMMTIGRLLTEVKIENQVFIRQSVLAKDFGVSRVTFIRHLNKARELGIIEPDPREGNAKHNIHLWRICPFLVWKGDRHSLNTYLGKLPKNHIWLTKWLESGEEQESNNEDANP